MGQSSESGVTTDGQAFSVGYAGDVDVLEAWEGVKNNPSAVLVDVRTTAEWNFVGTPDLSGAGREPVLIEWQVFPTMDVNASFVDAVIAASPPKAGRL